MTEQELMSLAERCEAATGAAFVLDREISDAMGHGGQLVRNYTASLDAAMTLVPEGHDVQVHLYFGRDGEGSAIVTPLKRINLPRIFAATPALALCAASLRARASSDAGGRG